jgi:hypothetical protein
VVDVLRRAVLWDEAEQAASSLPDSLDLDQVEAFCLAHRITSDTLVSLLGGSP